MSNKFQVGDFWRTRDGRKARIICVDATKDYPIVALIINVSNENEAVMTYTRFGCSFTYSSTPYDLIEPWTEPRSRMLAFFNIASGKLSLHKSPISLNPDYWSRAPWLDEPEGEGK